MPKSWFDLAADFAQAEATGARRDFVQQLARVDLLVFVPDILQSWRRSRPLLSARFAFERVSADEPLVAVQGILAVVAKPGGPHGSGLGGF